MTRERVLLIGLWALPLLTAAAAEAHDGPDPSDLPASVAAPPLRTLRAKEVARVAGEHPFDVPGVDAVFFFRGGSVLRLEVVGPKAGRQQKLVEDHRLLDVAHDERNAVTAFTVGGRAFAVLKARPTALLLDLDRGRVLGVRARIDGGDPVALEVRNLVLDGAMSVLCYARVTSGPSDGKDVWTKLDLASGDATLLPCPDCQRNLAAEGGLFFDGEDAVEIDTGRKAKAPDRRLLPHYEFEDRDRVLIAALPLRIIDWEKETRTVGVARGGVVTFPVLFPRDVREPLRAEVGDGFAAYFVRAERDDVFLAEMRPEAQARRIAHGVDEGQAGVAVLSGGHCVFRGEFQQAAFVYSFDRHAVFDPFGGTRSLLTATAWSGLRVSTGVTAVSSGQGTSPKGIWGAAQILRRVYPDCDSCSFGGDPSWPVLPLTVLISPHGNRFVVDYPKTTEAYGAAALFNKGALVVPAVFNRGRTKGPLTPGLVLYRLQLPDESPLPRPAPSSAAIALPQPVDRVLNSGLYLRREISPAVDGRWLGLVPVYESYEEPRSLEGEDCCFVFDSPDRYEVAECEVATRELASGVEALSALAVRTSCSVPAPQEWLKHDTELFLVRGLPSLTPGPVTMAKKTKDERGATALRLGDARYLIETVSVPGATSTQSTTLRLSFGSVAQDLLTSAREASVKSGFDLDRDGRLDLYVEQPLSDDKARGERTRRILFLSSLAKPGDLVGEAGRIDVEPIAPAGWEDLAR